MATAAGVDFLPPLTLALGAEVEDEEVNDINKSIDIQKAVKKGKFDKKQA